MFRLADVVVERLGAEGALEASVLHLHLGVDRARLALVDPRGRRGCGSSLLCGHDLDGRSARGAGRSKGARIRAW